MQRTRSFAGVDAVGELRFGGLLDAVRGATSQRGLRLVMHLVTALSVHRPSPIVGSDHAAQQLLVVLRCSISRCCCVFEADGPWYCNVQFSPSLVLWLDANNDYSLTL